MTVASRYDDAPDVFRLPSNRGWDLVEGRFIRAVVPRGERLWHIELRCAGRSFRRDGSPPGELVEDYDFLFPQVMVTEEGVEALLAALRRWLDGGLKGEEEFTLEFGSGDIQFLVEVGTRADLICRPDTPAFFLHYSAGKARAEVLFAVDHSCLTALATDLARILGLAKAA